MKKHFVFNPDVPLNCRKVTTPTKILKATSKLHIVQVLEEIFKQDFEEEKKKVICEL